MWMPRTLLVNFLNSGITGSLIILLLLALRPLLRRLPAQSRTLLWCAVWLPTIYYQTSLLFPLRFGFQSLFVARTMTQAAFGSTAEYIPSELTDGGTLRSIVLPGGKALALAGTPEQIYQLSDRLFFWMTLLWLAGILVLGWITLRRSLALDNLLDAAEPLDWKMQRELLKEYGFWRDPEIVRCKGLPTSFVRSKGGRYQICLQDELPPEQLHMVLLHEASHIKARHCYAKGMFFAACLFQWFNPLYWLAYRFFCKDLELACDEATVRRLGSAHKEDYAEMLLELASAKPIWGSPTSFGECDAALRIRSVLHRPMYGTAVRVLSVLLILAFGYWLIAPVPEFRAPTGELESTFAQFVELKHEFTEPGEFFSPEELEAATAIWYHGPTSENGDGAEIAVEGQDGSWKQYGLYCRDRATWKSYRSFFSHGGHVVTDVGTIRPSDFSGWTRVPLA